MSLYEPWINSLAPDQAFSWGFIFGFLLFGLMALFILFWLDQVKKDMAKNKAERKKDIEEAVKQAFIEALKDKEDE
jgi:hypothetical protein